MSTYKPNDRVRVLFGVDEEPTEVIIDKVEGVWHYGHSPTAGVEGEYKFLFTQIISWDNFKPKDKVIQTSAGGLKTPMVLIKRDEDTGPGWWWAGNENPKVRYRVHEQDLVRADDHSKYKPDDIVLWTNPYEHQPPHTAKLKLIEPGIVGEERGWWKAVDVDHGFEYTVREQDFVHWGEPAVPADPNYYLKKSLYGAKRKLFEAIKIINEQLEELNVNGVDTGDQGLKDNTSATD